jgi:hypothetical protein
MTTMTMTPITLALPPYVQRLMATMKGVRYIIVERATGELLDRNSYGKATRWSYFQRDRAIFNTYLADKQIRPAALVELKTGNIYTVSK